MRRCNSSFEIDCSFDVPFLSFSCRAFSLSNADSRQTAFDKQNALQSVHIRYKSLQDTTLAKSGKVVVTFANVFDTIRKEGSGVNT